MFATELIQADQIKRFTIAVAGVEGWQLRVEQNGSILRQVSYSDWHRVERALDGITREIAELKAGGWRERAVAVC